jgi:dihydrofolate reductase
MTLSLIASVARNGTIGRGNALVWEEPADKQFFKRTTMGCPVVMGRKTWDSLPPRFRPLPGRRNLVVTRQAGWQAAGAEVAHSLDEALALVADASRVFVIGGAELYAQALPKADELVLTEIDREIEGDAFFPRWERGEFDEVSSDGHAGYRFVIYRRKRHTGSLSRSAGEGGG